jgi:NAD(P)-dependent dehydrogenase (short-subunit alcohol dehydrogenase family)
MSLEGRVALVTGAGRGIGFRICCRLREEGAEVVFNDRDASEAAARYVGTSPGGSRAIFHQADISQLAQVEQMFERTLQEFGRLDILVNNAGIDPTAPFLQVSETLWHEVMGTNLKGTFFCAQKAAEKMCRTGQGRIVNISSVHSQASMPGGFSVYAASKGAINSLTRELALELAPLGITVNAVAPGAIEVERFVSNPVYDRAALAREIPLGRVGKPEDISGVVAFLCSDDASWLTGQVITVDGGTLTRLYLYAGRPIPSGPGGQTQDP